MSHASVIWKNGSVLATLLPSVEAEITMDDKGVSAATLNYSCNYTAAVGLVGALRRHPDFNWLKRKGAKISREEAGLARVSVSFEGISPEAEDEDNRTFSVSGTLSTEPVETHKKFVEIAGEWDDPSTWKNGARFVVHGEDRGRFLGFTADPAAENTNKAGMRSVPVPGLIYTEEAVKSSASGNLNANMAKLGFIDSPPASAYLPNVPDGVTWMLWECSVSQVGDGARIRRAWRASGPNGWDTDFFTQD